MTPVPTPSVTPVFASDEEALAAAEAAYREYAAISNEASADGWKNPNLLASYVTDDELARTTASYKELAATGRHTEGEATFDSVTLQRYDANEVVVYLCLDVSLVRLLDLTGTDVTPADRPGRLPLEVGFELDETGHLLLATSDIWDGGEMCAR